MSAIPSTVRLSPYRLNSPFVQNAACGLVLALAPGMFTALASLGAGGTQASNTKVSSTVSAVSLLRIKFVAYYADVVRHIYLYWMVCRRHAQHRGTAMDNGTWRDRIPSVSALALSISSGVLTVQVWRCFLVL